MCLLLTSAAFKLSVLLIQTHQFFEVYASRLYQLPSLLLRFLCQPQATPLSFMMTLGGAPFLQHIYSGLVPTDSVSASMSYLKPWLLNSLAFYVSLFVFLSSHTSLTNTYGLTFDIYNHQKLKWCQCRFQSSDYPPSPTHLAYLF